MTGASDDLHPSARRVQEALAAAGSDAAVRQLEDSTRTSAEAAQALGVEVGQIAKSLVFLADGRPLVVVASGADRVDTEAVARAVGAKRVSRADAGAVRDATGYPIGGVSPVGLGPGITVLVEEALARFERVWAAAGTPNAVYPTSFAELLSVTRGRPADVRQRALRLDSDTAGGPR
ncbi:MAG: YbaK/EbsC family protein [Acidimicrobiales bacterium]